MIERFEPEVDALGAGNPREAGGEARDVVDQQPSCATVPQPRLVAQPVEPFRNLRRSANETAVGQLLGRQRMSQAARAGGTSRVQTASETPSSSIPSRMDGSAPSTIGESTARCCGSGRETSFKSRPQLRLVKIAANQNELRFAGLAVSQGLPARPSISMWTPWKTKRLGLFLRLRMPLQRRSRCL